MLTVVRSGIP